MRIAAAWILLAAIAGPLLWALVGSFRPEAELFAGQLLPGALSLEHYRALFEERNFWRPIRSSLFVAGSTTALAIFFAVPCAYALARLKFRGKEAILGGILAATMLPDIAIVSPLYLLLRSLGLIDTHPGLILPYLSFTTPIAVWFLHGSFRQLPEEIEEAAFVDGASRLRVLMSIVLPLALPSIAASALLTFMYAWNELLFALAFTHSPDTQTVPVALALLRGRYQIPWGQILAAAVVATAPVALLVLIFQRRIVSGLTSGATKG